VVNAGRGPTSVTSVTLLFEEGGAVDSSVHQPPLPFRLAGESEQTWHFAAQDAYFYIRAFQQDMTSPYLVRAAVGLGGKQKPVISRNKVAVPDLAPGDDS
jgi:hypothetical protein